MTDHIDLRQIRQDFEPERLDWFSPEVRYDGEFCADIVDPVATLRGTASVTCTGSGTGRVTLQVEATDTCEESLVAPMQLEHPVRDAEGNLTRTINFGPHTPRGKCSRIEITTPGGLLTSNSCMLPRFGFGFSVNTPFEGTVLCQRLLFRSSGNATSRYWVVALLNFRSDSFRRCTDSSIVRHPLRLFRGGSVPSGLAGDQLLVAEETAKSRDDLISFEAFGKPGFIEAVSPDAVHKRGVEPSSSIHCSVTAIAVGEMPDGIDPTGDMKWFPEEFFDLLSLATGREVGIAWLELRGSNGALIQRLHPGYSSPLSVTGQPTVDSFACQDTGKLLTEGLRRRKGPEGRLLGLVRLAIRAGCQHQSVEDRWSYLIRSYERLAKAFEVQRTDLLLSLSDDNRDRVIQILAATTSRFAELRSDLRQTGSMDEAKVVNQIQRRAKSNATKKGQSFGDSVIALLHLFGFHDESAMNNDLRTSTRNHGLSWVDAMTEYRNQVIHEAFIDFDGEADMDAFEMCDHLHDILVRMLLKLCGYTGTYDPRVCHYANSAPIGWVTTSTPSDRLGYWRESIWADDSVENRD